MNDVLVQLKNEPALAWMVAVGVLGHIPGSPQAEQAAQVVRASPLVSALLAGRDTTGQTYRKWTGAHWLLSIFADLGCPPGDESLRPLMEQTLDCWLGESHKKYIQSIAGRTRFALCSAIRARRTARSACGRQRRI